MPEPYKRCGHCGKIWPEREDLVRDEELKLIGFQATYGDPTDGLLLFNHTPAHCRTTLAIRAGDFADYAATGIAAEAHAPHIVCPGHCLRVEDLAACSVACNVRWVREVIQFLRRHTVPVTNPLGADSPQAARRTA